jgi:hypothetical protein
MIRVEDKLEEATNLIVEAKYIIEEVINNPQYPNILGTKNREYLETTTELISMLSKIEDKKIADLPIEAVYKFLYLSYKKTQEENSKLKQDLKQLLVRKDLDEEKQVLILKLMRSERENEDLKKQFETVSRKLAERTIKYRNKIKELKAQL